MNYYQHHIGDFIRDTARLTDSQCVAYLRMIWIYYETEQPLENDADAVAFKIGANASDVHQIFKHFFFLHDGFWHQSRCDAEILAFRAKSDKAKKSADARWKNAKLMRTHSERNANEPVSDANQKPETSNQSKELKPKAAKAARFDPLSLDLGINIPSDAWLRWISYRRKRKLSNTEDTLLSQVAKLTEWAQAGDNPADVIAQSIEKGWQGLFELKRSSAGPPKANGYHDSLVAAGKAIFGDLSNDQSTGRIIDINESPARQVGGETVSGTARQLRQSLFEPVEDRAATS